MADSEIPVNWRGQAVLSLQNEGGLRRDKTRKSIECPILNVLSFCHAQSLLPLPIINLQQFILIMMEMAEQQDY
jgi:hypothetical protein